MYSLASPLVRPRRADLTICGNHIEVYAIVTNTTDNGDKMTRAMSVKKMIDMSPYKRASTEINYKRR